MSEPTGVRLQKVLSQAGVASRRVSEDLIVAGRVSINGAVVRELGVRVEPDDVIHVDGRRIVLDPEVVTVMLNKPAGVVSAMSDPQGRRCVAEFVADRPERLYHVGRLDFETEGLLLLTNDGELANRLMHPSWEVSKTYRATVTGRVSPTTVQRVLAGVELDDGPVRPDKFRVVDSVADRTLVEVVLHEGRNRIVRRLLAEVGHPVERLVRTRMADLNLGTLRPGQTRELTRAELGDLMAAVGL